MLGVAEPILEAQLEARMVERIKDVMLELGYGFAFFGNQYQIVANNKPQFRIASLPLAPISAYYYFRQRLFSSKTIASRIHRLRRKLNGR